MEEAAQILEIETFIPLLLQTSDQQGRNRLKRCIMIGDHHQLPPVIKNMAFQKYSNMEQALFTRLVRLGVPTVDLDAQGRARSSLCSLYNWRYKNLGNLEHVLQQREFKTTNAGFVYDYQLINVENFNDIGESEPIPYFYQVRERTLLSSRRSIAHSLHLSRIWRKQNTSLLFTCTCVYSAILLRRSPFSPPTTDRSFSFVMF